MLSLLLTYRGFEGFFLLLRFCRHAGCMARGCGAGVQNERARTGWVIGRLVTSLAGSRQARGREDGWGAR